MFSPKHLGALDLLPFQGFGLEYNLKTCTRKPGIQVFRLYSRPSPVTDRNVGRAGLGWMSGYKCMLLAGMVLGIVFVTMLPDTVDDSNTSTGFVP